MAAARTGPSTGAAAPTSESRRAERRRRKAARRRRRSALVIVAALIVPTLAGLVRMVTARGSGDAEQHEEGTRPILLLRDHTISGSLAVEEGDVTFAVVNGGRFTHNVGVRGGPITADLAPGRAGTLAVLDIAPGTYELYCDIGDHEAQGMVAPLQVVAAPGTTS